MPKAYVNKEWALWAYAKMVFMVGRHVKLFKNGRNQAVRIPREFELPGEDAVIHKRGND